MGQRIVIHSLEAVEDRSIHQTLCEPLGRQLSLEPVASHRTACERGREPSNRIPAIVKIAQRGQTGNNLRDISRRGALAGEKTFDLCGRAVNPGEIPHGSVEPVVRRLRSGPLHRAALEGCRRHTPTLCGRLSSRFSSLVETATGFSSLSTLRPGTPATSRSLPSISRASG